MNLPRALVRPVMAASCAIDGARTLKSPQMRVRSAKRMGLERPEVLVRAHAVAMLVAGLAFATGRVPRLAAVVLAATTVPTAVADHPFWSETDPHQARRQQNSFLMRLSMLGGFLLAALDTGGRESLPHAAGRQARRAQRRAARLAHASRTRSGG